MNLTEKPDLINWPATQITGYTKFEGGKYARFILTGSIKLGFVHHDTAGSHGFKFKKDKS